MQPVEDVVPEVPALAAMEKDVRNGLSSRSTVATVVGDIWDSSGEQD